MSSSPQISGKRRLRRSKRLALSATVLVHGKDLSGKPFRESTRTLALNAHGALLALSNCVEVGQRLLVENSNTRREQECRVAYVGSEQNGKWRVGIEFTHIAKGFWEISFPPPVGSRQW